MPVLSGVLSLSQGGAAAIGAIFLDLRPRQVALLRPLRHQHDRIRVRDRSPHSRARAGAGDSRTARMSLMGRTNARPASSRAPPTLAHPPGCTAHAVPADGPEQLLQRAPVWLWTLPRPASRRHD